MDKYIKLGDVLVESRRVAGARLVPADSPAATEKSRNCVRLQLKGPAEVVSVNPLAGDDLEQLFQEITDLLNGVEGVADVPDTAGPEAADTGTATEADAAVDDEGDSAEGEAELPDEAVAEEEVRI